MNLGAAENDAQREATYRFLNDEIADQHRMLVQEAAGLDTKATVVAGFAAAAVSFLLAHPGHTIWSVSLAGYLLALALAVGALWPRRWHGLVLSALRDELSEAAPLFVIGVVAGTKVTIYERNYRNVRDKALLWGLSVVSLAVGSGLSVWTTIKESVR